jgi:hypothetical protein
MKTPLFWYGITTTRWVIAQKGAVLICFLPNLQFMMVLAASPFPLINGEDVPLFT